MRLPCHKYDLSLSKKQVPKVRPDIDFQHFNRHYSPTTICVSTSGTSNSQNDATEYKKGLSPPLHNETQPRQQSPQRRALLHKYRT